MGWIDDLADYLKRFGRKPPDQPPPDLPALDPRRINCGVSGLATDTPALLADDGTSAPAAWESPTRAIFTVPPGRTGGATLTWGASRQRVTYYDALAQAWRDNLPPEAGDYEGPPLAYPPPRQPARPGNVSVVARGWQDGAGRWFPLGTTLFWALGGVLRGDRDRVRRNIRFARDEMFADYVRVLGQVNWPGEAIDPRAPGYAEALGWLADCAYDEGLRLQVTAIGGGSPDVPGAARAVATATAGRRHKFIMLEGVNEGNASTEDAVSACLILAATGIPSGVGLGDQGIEKIKAAGDEAAAAVDYFHKERTQGDDGARQVRQCWDLKEFRRACVDNEPPGPASSVATCEDPFLLASQRAASVICGAGAFCLHTGHGVYGRAMDGPYGHRYANLWEAPGLPAAAAAVRAAVARLPVGIEGWQKFNTGHPVDVASGDVNKLYGARSGGRFAEIAIGCRGPVTFRARVPCALEIINPATGELIGARALAAGETWAVTGLRAYVLVGS